MELDFSQEWHIIAPREGGRTEDPAAFAALELASIIGRMGCRAPAPGDESFVDRLIVLDAGHSPSRTRGSPRFSWRASSARVEIYGEDESSLLRGAYDFLGALGAHWVGPGREGERLPTGPILSLAQPTRASADMSLPTTLILGHGAYLEDWEEQLLWAARAGYGAVFVHTTPEALALGAAPESLYEALRPSLSAAARRLGLSLELGGHCLSSLLPRSLFKLDPELFRESKGTRVNDRNFCPSSAKALAIVSEAFASRAAAHPEVSVFHAWPDDLPSGGWCSCPACALLSPAEQSLRVARALSEELARARPDAALSFLAYHDTEDVAAVLAKGESSKSAGAPENADILPPNLELLWAPRRRSWGSALGDTSNGLNAASLARFQQTARAWRASGGGRVAVFEYYEDAMLFKGAVPPLTAVIEGDLKAYRGEADAIGILCAGGRLPLGPRPNAYLLPRLAKDGAPRAQALLAEWALAAYGPSAAPMLEYWRELESAWALDLDLEEGETEVHIPDRLARCAMDPPSDWGDPWKAGSERLAQKRDRCEDLFDHLRRAEACLAEASLAMGQAAEARALRGEALEYSISGSVLELDCARLSAYHELAAGDPRAAADIANLALSASSAVRKALSALSDRRARREVRFLIRFFYDLRLRAIRRANARSGLRRLADLWYTTAQTALAALSLMRAYDGKGIATAPSRR